MKFLKKVGDWVVSKVQAVKAEVLGVIGTVTGATAASMVMVDNSEAALNAGVATAFTALQTDALALVDLIWPVVTAITVAFIIVRLFKRGASAAV